MPFVRHHPSPIGIFSALLSLRRRAAFCVLACTMTIVLMVCEGGLVSVQGHYGSTAAIAQESVNPSSDISAPPSNAGTEAQPALPPNDAGDGSNADDESGQFKEGQTQELPESSGLDDSVRRGIKDGYVPKESITVKRKIAPVVLDGEELFDVAGYENISAEERASDVAATLEAWVNKQTIPVISIEEGRGTTTIVLQPEDAVDQDELKVPLITVTKADAIRDLRTPQAQAEKWVSIIDEALEKARKERNPENLWRSIVLATATFILACVIFWYLGSLQKQVSQQPLKQLKRLLQGKVNRDGIPIHVRQVVFALCLKGMRYGVWIAVTFFITQLFPATRRFSHLLRTGILASFKTDIFPLGGQSYSLIDLLILIAGFLIVVIGSTLVTNLLKTRILQLAGISSGAQQAIATLSRYTLIALGTVVILQLWGLDLSSLTIIASALGVGIGFGLQNIARDFGSGVILLFERPIQVGDFIEVGVFRGTVDRIGARSTTIKTLAQVSVIVPNSYFLENQVVNWSHDNPLSRISIPIGVSYSTDPETVKSLLLQAGTTHKGVLQIPAPQVLFKGFGDNSLNFELLVWIVEPNRQLLIQSDLNFSVLTLLRDHGIEIPYPQRDLHIRTGSFPTFSTVQDVGMESNMQLERRTPQDNHRAQD